MSHLIEDVNRRNYIQGALISVILSYITVLVEDENVRYDLLLMSTNEWEWERECIVCLAILFWVVMVISPQTLSFVSSYLYLNLETRKAIF